MASVGRPIAPAPADLRILEDAHARFASSQVLVVRASGVDGTDGFLRAFELRSGAWRKVLGPTPVRLGRSGVAREKVEGDGRTPLGTFRISEAFGFGDNPGSKLPYLQLRGDEVWVDDPESPVYNTLQHERATPNWVSAERLSEARDAYEWAVVIDFNRRPRISGRGSAIFLHVDPGEPTTGCVAIGRSELRSILRWFRPGSMPTMAITT